MSPINPNYEKLLFNREIAIVFYQHYIDLYVEYYSKNNF